MIAEDAFTEKYVSRVREAVRQGLRHYLYNTKYQDLTKEETFHLMAEAITKDICVRGFWD